MAKWGGLCFLSLCLYLERFNCGCRALSLPTLDLSYEDIRLMTSVTQDSVPLQAGIVEFVKLKDRLKFVVIYLVSSWTAFNVKFSSYTGSDLISWRHFWDWLQSLARSTMDMSMLNSFRHSWVCLHHLSWETFSICMTEYVVIWLLPLVCVHEIDGFLESQWADQLEGISHQCCSRMWPHSYWRHFALGFPGSTTLE